MKAELVHLEIRANALAGCSIYLCLRECAILALREDVRVILTHNQRDYTIDPSELLVDLQQVFTESKA